MTIKFFKVYLKFILSLLGLEELVLQRLEEKEDKPEEVLEEYDVFRYNLKPESWIKITTSPIPIVFFEETLKVFELGSSNFLIFLITHVPLRLKTVFLYLMPEDLLHESSGTLTKGLIFLYQTKSTFEPTSSHWISTI